MDYPTDPAQRANMPGAPTAFQFRVYDALMLIPPGKVATYGALAQHLGSCARAVGQALRRNPYAPTVPCHRIVSADTALGGFCGQTEGPKIAEKRRLLESEGVVFVDARVSPTCLFVFPTRTHTATLGPRRCGVGKAQRPRTRKGTGRRAG